MNPIDSYRDPALDILVNPPNPAPVPAQAPVPTQATSRSSRHSRQPSTAIRDSQSGATPRGQPIIYPGAESTGQGVQRSFSQRARERPYANEAFAGPTQDIARDLQSAEKRSSAQVPHHQRQSLQPEIVQPPAIVPAPIASSSDRRNSRRQQVIQDNIQAAANAARPSREAYIDTSYDDEPNGNYAGMTQAPTMKDAAAGVDQREWAPDRSPLQKLEVTLNDISKEEKRARMQEAELLHREKTRSQKPSTHDAPRNIDDVGVVRNLSNTHKDRLQHSTVIDSRKPDPAVLSGNSRGFDYSSAFPPSRSVTITRRSRRSGDEQPVIIRAVSSSNAQPQVIPAAATTQRSVSAAQHPLQSNATSAVPSQDLHSARQNRIRDSDRTPTSQERNASHRAALERLTGNNVPQSRKDATTIPQSTIVDTGEPIRAVDTNTRQSYQRAVPNLLSDARAQDSPGLHSTDSPIPTDNSNNLLQGKKRRSSVSFKEPYDRRKPVDEWKSAETARLLTADFLLSQEPDPSLNKAWWEEGSQSRQRSSKSRAAGAGNRIVTIDDRSAEFRPKLLLKCGPLLRYTGMKRTVGDGAQEYWRGTMMMVTQDSQSSYEKVPTLRLYSHPKTLYKKPAPVQVTDNQDSIHEDHDPIAGTVKISRIGRALYVKPARNVPSGHDLSAVETDDGLFESSPPITNADGQNVSVAPVSSRLGDKSGESCGRYKEIKGVRLYADPDRDVTFWLFKLEIQLGTEQQHIGYRINNGAASGFWVPAIDQTMNIMFHSCNGFSMSVKTDEFSGPDPMWRDVLNVQQSRPFHVMIGGGDQIYNDKVMRDTRHFGEWTAHKNPHHKHIAAFTPEMKEELESFYLDNYCHWFSQGLFGVAAAQIPMVNIWDDHDIIDGFGSYPHAFMLSPVFSGIGNVAFKYYMLFQQHSVEAMTGADEPSWLLGYKPGPYIKQLSRSIFLDFGKHVAFLGLDCRTERTKNQVVSLDTCDMALERCRKEIVEGVTKHLIVLLGVPIAYPRMNWLENVLTSRAMDPVKALGRYGVIKGGFLNRFDGGVEVLDDLDDHWTAQHHKEERNEFIKELQDLAAERSVRITILGGDVHLAAIGQFYSNPKLKIPKDRDHRYMPNVVSSAIVNTPPPEMLADVLNKRNKVHHLDSYTDESMIPMFTHDVDLKKRNNKHLLPRRNWCSITEPL